MAVMPETEDTGVPLDQIGWGVTVVVCLVTVVILLLSGYVGYGAVVFAIACSAAINLRLRRDRTPAAALARDELVAGEAGEGDRRSGD
jgi:hypothetical protein